MFGIISGLVSLIPGVGTAGAIIVAGHRALTGIVSSLVFNTISETKLPLVSGNASAQSTGESIEANPKWLMQSIAFSKLVMWFVGLLVGYMITPLTGLPILGIFVSVVFFLTSPKEERMSIAIWIGGTILLFGVLTAFGIPYVIAIIGLCLFTIPSLIIKQDVKKTRVIDMDGQGPAVVATAFYGLVGMILPGISPGLLISRGLKDNVVKYIAGCTVETFMEAVSLVWLLKGVASGKTLIGMYVTGVSIWSIVSVSLIVVGLTAILIMFSEQILAFYNLNESVGCFIGAIVGTIQVIMWAGWLAPVLIIIGIGTNLFVRALPHQASIGGFTFISRMWF